MPARHQREPLLEHVQVETDAAPPVDGISVMKARTNASGSTGRCKLILSRWGTVLYATAVTTVVLPVVLHLLWRLWDKRPLQQEFPLGEIWLLVAALLLCHFLAESIRLRNYRFRDIVRYPPIWFSAPAALLIICVLEKSLPLVLYASSESNEMQTTISPTLLILCATMIAILYRCGKLYIQSHNATPLDIIGNQPESIEEEHWINSGERPITTAEDDRFSGVHMSDRVMDHIRKNEPSMALIGPMGSGKSSILNLVFECIAQSDPSTLVVRCDLWRARTPEEIPQVIISSIVNALDSVCDTIGLRDLPYTYRRLVAAEPSGTLHRIFSIDDQTTSLHKLDRVYSILEILDRRIVLAVEDFERLPSSFDATHLSRFLWALREIPRCCTIIAVDPQRARKKDSKKDLDLAKLCDFIETVPEMSTEKTASELIDRYEYWRSRYKNDDLQVPDGGFDKFEFDRIKEYGIQTYLLNPVHSNPINMVAKLLATPRFVKQALHRIDRVWEQLHGEVDLSDLIILTVLRCCAPDTFRFIVANIRVARLTSEGIERGLIEGFQQDWKQVLSQETEQEAVCYLVDMLGIAQLRAKRAPYPNASASHQGVHLGGTTDYFSRIISGTLADDEVRDQRVLRDIKSSKSGNHHELADGLVMSAELNDRYMSTWLRFAKPSVQELLDISTVVIDTLLVRDSSEVNPNEPVLVALSSRLNAGQNIDEETRIENWLKTQSIQHVSKSLSLASGLVLFCIRARRRDEGEGSLAQIVLDEIAAQIVAPQQLLDSLPAKYPATVRVLLQGIRTRAEAENTKLISLLLRAAELSEQRIIPQLIYLLVVDSPPTATWTDGGELIGVEHSNINFERLHILFNGHESDVLELLSRYSGSDERCLRVKNAAQDRLASQDTRIGNSH